MKRRTTSEKEDRYRDILENIDEGYFEVNLKGDFTFVNPAMARILGYDRQDLIGLNYRKCLDNDVIPKIYESFHQVFLSGGAAMLLDGRHTRRDGTVSELETSVALLRDEQEHPVGFRGIVRDITERKRLERHLIQMHKMEAIGTLAGGIAHDFNNLLMGIRGLASLMRLDLEPDHPHHQKLLQIEAQVDSGSELTRQLLGFAREGRYEIRVIDLGDILSRTAAVFGRTRKDVTIECSLDSGLRPVQADQGQIEQVLMGLCINAGQAMPGGGQLALEAQNVTVGENEEGLSGLKPGPYVRITVRDTGIGMDEDTLERIFEPFFTTKEMGRRAGLGLASAYGIVKNHGGAIRVASREGEGSVFEIFLPAADRVPEPVTGERKYATAGQRTILLVDDEQMVIEVSREILEMLGYRVIQARSGQQAVALYQARGHEIDLVLLDMIMPGMSGGDTFDRLKTINPDVRVILSTGYSLSGQAREIMARGCRGFIQKPFKIEMLSSKIREVLEVSVQRE